MIRHDQNILDMNHPLAASSLNNLSSNPNMREAPEQNHNENRRANSLSVYTPNTSYYIKTCPSPDDNFNSRQSLNNVPSIDNSVRKRDHLTVLYSVTDGVLIITAIIFVIALGFVAVIVVMALIKVYFLKDKLDSIWADDWFWPG